MPADLHPADLHPAAAAFGRIAGWLRGHAPDAAAHLRPPATDEALAALADRLARPARQGLTAAGMDMTDGRNNAGPATGGVGSFGAVPGDLAAVLRTHDGGEFVGLLPVVWDPEGDPDLFDLLDCEGIAWNWECQRDLTAVGQFADAAPEHTDPGVRAVWWDVRWLPVGENGGGDLVLLDFAPAAGGTAGQVISHDHETGAHRVQAPSLAAYLGGAADLFGAGRIAWDGDELAFASDGG